MVVVRFLLRFLLIPLGLLAATLAMTLVLGSVLGGKFLARLSAQSDADLDAIVLMLFAIPGLLQSLATISFTVTLPALLAIAIAEIAAIRWWLYYPAAGGLAAFIGWWSMLGVREVLNEPTLLTAAGIVGGFAYWLVAGWNAGFWKPVFEPRPVPLSVPQPPAR